MKALHGAHRATRPRKAIADEDEGEEVCSCSVSIAYGGRTLLNKTKLRLHRGQRYGLCGPNGTGKTTLMRTIANGQVEGFSPADVLKTIFVEHNVQADQTELSVLEFILTDETLAARKHETVKMLESVGFDDERLKQHVTSLSGGWKMKVELARAIGSSTTLTTWWKAHGQHLDKTPNEYIRWRYRGGDDRESPLRASPEFTEEEEAAKEGMYQCPVTAIKVEKHLIDVGLPAEFATHSRIRGLSAEQKMKVVLGAALWNNPQMLVLDEPTNYLDRDLLGALADAIQGYGGGVVIISHDRAFTGVICHEQWDVEAGRLTITGSKQSAIQRWGMGMSDPPAKSTPPT
ncbi:hypothetical protein HK097_010540 [Rhizophlyctis rosea]|uniref:ABC transporter domain-containing protein n=1 Tax=Rhizophlyctis rosea TaxID=64517 RepID=A0AAD5SAQ0_9FUNG|nr:hypothetical protein HK097_010540 [Rhizophlyctis rosea]